MICVPTCVCDKLSDDRIYSYSESLSPLNSISRTPIYTSSVTSHHGCWRLLHSNEVIAA